MGERMLYVENRQGQKVDIYEELRSQKAPLYCVGIGNVANEVYNRLQEHHICLDGFVVTVATEQKKRFGLPVQSIENMLKQTEKPVNLIIGHAQYHKKKELEQLKNVERVFYILNPFTTHEDVSYEYYKKHQEAYEKAYELFEERFSKDVFEAYLNTRVNDDLSYLLDHFRTVNTFFENEIFSLGKEESYVDVGAYNGDTIRKFCHAVRGEYKRIYAFEPDMEFYAQMLSYIEEEQIQRIECFPIGLWKEKTVLVFAKDEEQSGKVVSESNDAEKIEVDSMDHLLSDCEVSLVKISLSAGALECLQGAENIIRRKHPKIVVTVGIQKDQLYEIPQFIKRVDSSYNLFLRFNESMPSRLTLYAV